MHDLLISNFNPFKLKLKVNGSKLGYNTKQKDDLFIVSESEMLLEYKMDWRTACEGPVSW